MSETLTNDHYFDGNGSTDAPCVVCGHKIEDHQMVMLTQTMSNEEYRRQFGRGPFMSDPLDRAAITRYRVDSSSLKAIGYQDGVCVCEFQNGHLFAYPMEHREFEKFAAAESKGRYFNQAIRGRFKGEKLTSKCSQCGSEPEIVGRRCPACGCETIKPMDTVHKERL